ncbi:peptidoglycan-binding domain-containing protein [Lysobacter firmicutimachus]|uniref:Peptidoglycan-binding domain-containing protein n=1 Tax=Lysobacter firmicutimachus TaxID=1792846 RepID=A0AAU8MS81_9GAMM|nr:peptidoglycan-binding protein [Lysobacter antibioticus]
MADDIEKAKRAINSWHIGQTSSGYESSGKGAGTISTGVGDAGGVSYGEYQLSSKKGTVQEYLEQSRYGDQFKGLTPATPEFNAKWKQLAASDPGFGKDQHDFIGRSHFDKQNEALKARGIDLSDRGRAVHDALWSTSVQFRGLTPDIFDKGMKEAYGKDYKLSELSDKQIVEAVQDYKIAHNNTLFKSSPDWWPGLLKRANNEKDSLVQLANQEALLKNNGIEVPPVSLAPGNRSHDAAPRPAPSRDAMADGVLKLDERGPAVRELQDNLNRLGFRDAQGHPLSADGHFGKHTKEAVEAFQRAHGLDDDGKAGRDTLNAIKNAAPAQRRNDASPQGPLLSDPAHPNHALYKQAFDGLEKLGPQAGYPHREDRERAAAAMAYEAKAGGLSRIDHVVPNASGSGVFAVQGALNDPAHLRAHVDKAQAATQSVQQTSQQLQQDAAQMQPVSAAPERQAPRPAMP